MKVRRVSDIECLEVGDCKNLVITNYGECSDGVFWLPTLGKSILGDIVILGAADYSISFQSVEIGKIITSDGPKSMCSIASGVCAGSRTTITYLFGEAWHVSSNVPLLFE